MAMRQKSNIRGFSLIELLIVILLISVIGVVSAFYLSAYQKLYKADEQALSFIDLLQEARQRSLTQREILRVELDLDDNVARLIDENTPLDADDDRVVRTVTLKPATQVTIDSRPSNISLDPPETFPVPLADFKLSVYTNSVGHTVCTMRFTSNGNVLDAGTDEDGSGAVPTGVTIYVWMPDDEDDQAAKIARAVTVIGSTGSIRFWEYDASLVSANKWKDSRRFGS